LQLLSVTPRIKKDILSNIPVVRDHFFLDYKQAHFYLQVGDYWRDAVPQSDKPF
jgi:hypothetical protein